MSKMIGVAVAITAIVAAIIAWSKFAFVNREAAAAITAAATEDRPIISPFDAMTKHGKNRPAN
jgi:hypothetical protein